MHYPVGMYFIHQKGRKALFLLVWNEVWSEFESFDRRAGVFALWGGHREYTRIPYGGFGVGTVYRSVPLWQWLEIYTWTHPYWVQIVRPPLFHKIRAPEIRCSASDILFFQIYGSSASASSSFSKYCSKSNASSLTWIGMSKPFICCFSPFK